MYSMICYLYQYFVYMLYKTYIEYLHITDKIIALQMTNIYLEMKIACLFTKTII